VSSPLGTTSPDSATIAPAGAHNRRMATDTIPPVGRPPAPIAPELERELRRAMRQRDRAAAHLETVIDRALEAGTPPAAVARTLGLTRAAMSDRARRRRETGGDQRRSGSGASDAHGLDSQEQPS